MRTETCQCGQTLFHDNSQCVRCQSPVGRCAVCGRIATLIRTIDDGYQCHHDDCQAKLALCDNYATRNVCNWTVPGGSGAKFCDSCQLTEVIPDLSRPELWERWFQMEAAKRRLLYSLNLLNLPYRRSDPRANPPLKFQFLDASASHQSVTTGHQNGCITINLAEADAVEREKTRVAFGEPQRTVIGHFRHEIGHYYWEVLVRGRDEERFRALFGDERTPSYEEAQKRYYQQGPRSSWEAESISAYATMHPWEDFAESFAGYLDIISLLDTAQHHRLIQPPPEDFPAMVLAYQKLAVILNETTRERGLLDLVPEVLTSKVVKKLGYVHQLIHGIPPGD